MILAAGYGTRMGVLSRDIPKALLPLWNRSLLARAVDVLVEWGVRDILINAHHSTDQIIREAMALSDGRARIAVSHEPDILGTGGALRKAEWFFDEDPFWLINADIVADLNPVPLLEAMCARKTMAALWMIRDRGPRSVLVQRNRIVDFAAGANGTHTFCGLHLLRRDILQYLPDTGFASIIDAYRAAMRDGYRIAGVEAPDAYWADVGTPERYRQSHRETATLFAPGVSVDVSIAPTAHIGKMAVVSNSVVLDGAIIAPKSVVRDAIIGRQTRVRGRVSGIVVRAALGLSPDEQHALRDLTWDIDQSTYIEWPARGSARSFARVLDQHRSVVLMRYDSSRTENNYYIPQARFLHRAGWPVPRVLHHYAAHHWALLEDVGDDDLESRVKHHPGRALAWYRRVLDEVLKLHGPVTRAFRRARKIPVMPGFDAALYRYERDLFTQHYLKQHCGASDAVVRTADRILRRVARKLLPIKPVLLHRDLQSSNIYWRDDAPCFIDFQGMRLGPAAYDLASLVCDPYVALPRATRETLLREYAERIKPAYFNEQDYRYACVQRLCQAIGAYARLGALPGCERFLQHIPVALDLLHEACVDADVEWPG